MPVNTKGKLGEIIVSDNAIASLAGSTVCECYGIVGVVSKTLVKDKYHDLLKIDNYSKGVVVSKKKGSLHIDVYVIISVGVKISEVTLEAQKRVKYNVEKTLNIDVDEVKLHQRQYLM